MRYVMSPTHLPAAMAEVFRAPHSRLIDRLEVKPIEEIEEAQADLIIDDIDVSSLSNGGPLARIFWGYTPRELPQMEMFVSHDTPENRYANTNPHGG